MTKNVLTIGIGGGGINIINYLYVKKLVDSDFLAIDTDLQSLEPCVAQEKILLGERGLGYNSVKDDFDTILDEIKPNITEKISGYEKVVMVLGLGGNTSAKTAPYVLKLLNERSIQTFVICTFPFSYELNKKKTLALSCLTEINKLNEDRYFLRNDDLLDLNSHYTVEQIFGFQNEEIARKINAFIS